MPQARTSERSSLLIALAFFVATKALFLLSTSTVEMFPHEVLVKFDSGWYLGVARDGYLFDGHVDVERPSLAFFPLVPLLTRLGLSLGLPPDVALLAVTWLGSLAAVVGIWMLGRQVADARVGMWLAILWSVAPRAHIQVMGYAEGVFVAFVSFCLYGLLRRRWLLVGAMGFLAGLTRPAVVPLVATLGVVWLVDCIRERRPWRRVFGAQFWATVASGAGFLGYWLYVASLTGSFFGYLDVQSAWHQRLGGPWESIAYFLEVVWPNPAKWAHEGAVGLVVAGYLLLFVWLLVSRKEPWPLVLYSGLSILLVLSQQNYYPSYARFLLPVFPLWLPLARLAARVPQWVVWPLALIVAGLTTQWSASVVLLDYSP